MKRLLVIPTFILLFAIQSLAWERVTTQLDLANNADPNKAVVYNLWKSYLEECNDSISTLPQWNDADKRKWRSPDLLTSEGFLNMPIYRYYNKVLEIRPENDLYIIRSMLYVPYNDNSEVFVLAIINHIAKKDENGEFKLYNWVDYHTRNWPRKTVGLIEYCYYPEFNFNEDVAREANNTITLFRDKLCANVPEHITYYIAPNLYEQEKLKGFDYIIGMGDHVGNSGGSADRVNFIIYGDSVHGENYEHEISRCMINPSYPNAHFFMIQGISEYVHQSKANFGLTNRQHYQRMLDWLAVHPDADITNFDDAFYSMDNQTAPSYLVGEIICHELYKRGSYDALKRALNVGASDEKFFAFLKKEIGIGRENFTPWIKKKIAKYTQEDIPALR